MKRDSIVLTIFIIGLAVLVFADRLSRLSMEVYIFVTNADPMSHNLFRLSIMHYKAFGWFSLFLFLVAIIIRFLPGQK